MELSEPARLFLLASLLAKDGLISHNGKFFSQVCLKRGVERKNDRQRERGGSIAVWWNGAKSQGMCTKSELIHVWRGSPTLFEIRRFCLYDRLQRLHFCG